MAEIEIKNQYKKDYQIPYISDLVKKIVVNIDSKYKDGVKSIILLDDDPYGQEALGRYVSLEGTKFHDIHIYLSGIFKHCKKPLKDDILLSFLLGRTLCHELGHHYKELNKIHLHEFPKEQEEADMFAYNILMPALNKLFKFRLSFLMLKVRLYNLRLKKLFLSYLFWYPEEVVSGLRSDKIIGLCFIAISCLRLFLSLSTYATHNFELLFFIPNIIGIAVGLAFLFDWVGLFKGSLILVYVLVYIVPRFKTFLIQKRFTFADIISVVLIFYSYKLIKDYFVRFKKLGVLQK